MFALLLSLALASTVNIETTGRANSGDRVVSPSTGVALTVPDGFTASLQGEALIFESQTGLGGIILVDPGLTLQGAVGATQQGLQLGGGYFFADGAPQYAGNTVTIPLRSSDGSYVGHGYATLETATSLSLVVVGPAPQAQSVQTVFTQLVGSLGSAGNSAVPTSTATASSGPWHAALVGRQLRNYQTRDTMSSQTRVDLCTDGSLYVYTGGSFYSGPGSVAMVSGAGSSGSSGRWSVQGSTLTLHWPDGSTDSRTMSYGPNEEMLVNGERWLRADLERCR